MCQVAACSPALLDDELGGRLKWLGSGWRGAVARGPLPRTWGQCEKDRTAGASRNVGQQEGCQQVLQLTLRLSVVFGILGSGTDVPRVGNWLAKVARSYFPKTNSPRVNEFLESSRTIRHQVPKRQAVKNRRIRKTRLSEALDVPQVKGKGNTHTHTHKGSFKTIRT